MSRGLGDVYKRQYMHTQNEVISVADVDNTAKLIAEYIKCGGAFND